MGRGGGWGFSEDPLVCSCAGARVYVSVVWSVCYVPVNACVPSGAGVSALTLPPCALLQMNRPIQVKPADSESRGGSSCLRQPPSREGPLVSAPPPPSFPSLPRSFPLRQRCSNSLPPPPAPWGPHGPGSGQGFGALGDGCGDRVKRMGENWGLPYAGVPSFP